MKNLFLIATLVLFCTSSYGQNNQSNSGNLLLEISNGISMPKAGFEDFVKDGFNSELSLSKQFCKKISLGFGAKHSSFRVRQEFGPVQGSRNQYTSTTFDVGPQFSLGNSKFAIQVYGRTGLSVTSTPEIKSLQANTDITTEKLKQQSVKALSARIGAKIKTEVCTGLQLYVSSEYVTTLNSDINFYSKDLSKAIGADGRLDPDLASEIPFTTKNLKFSSLNVNFGVNIGIGSLCASNSKRNSNPLHQNSGTKAVNPMYQQRSSGHDNPMYQQNSNKGENVLYEGASNSGGNTGGTSGSKAQDYNSSRSNRTVRAKAADINGDLDQATRAQDYNSSRSNKRGITADTSGDDGNTDENNRGVEATDYNSSRSNKRGITADTSGDDGNTDTNNRGVEATDYNSSRSNKVDNISDSSGDDGNNDGSKATDYNSSRSNKADNAKSSDINRDGNLDNATKAQDYNSSRSNNEGSTKAQDYNSSRSNRRGVAKTDEDNEAGNNRGVEATDYNSSRSNKADNVSDSSGDDGNNDGSKATDYNSSRSNKADNAKSSDINRDGNLDNATKAQDYNSSRSNNEGSTKAQDYNSSRSNRRGVAKTNDDIRVSMTQAQKRKMKKKLKREERARLKKNKQQQKEEIKKRKMQASSIY